MKKLFVDTSAWVAMNDSHDDHYAQALTFNRQIARQTQLVVTNYILDESYTLLLLNTSYPLTIKFKRKLDILIQANILKVIWISPDLAEQAWRIFEQLNTDKAWSFTDCTYYVIMKEQGITEVFTFDRHFSQMGFIQPPNYSGSPSH